MGSWVHADSVKSIKANIIGVINFEMIGYFNEGDQPYPDERLKKLYPKRANFIAVVGKQSYHEFNQRVYELMKVDAGIDVQIIDHLRFQAPHLGAAITSECRTDCNAAPLIEADVEVTTVTPEIAKHELLQC